MVSGGEVKLFGMWASPAVRRVEWALKLKGIKYEYVEEDISNKSGALVQYNPINKQVPVLLHNGKPIVESLVILEYIDEVWKHHPILPKDPYERAMARFWAAYSEDKCRDAVRRVFFAEGGERAKAIECLEETLRALDGELEGKEFFGGENIGFSDLVLGWMAFWLGVSEEVASFEVLDPKKFPWFTSWIDNFLQVPAIKENLPPRDKTVAFFHGYRRLHLAAPNC
ncbi:glutathione transferase GST 23-like isoform X2 [Phoenix dactylifera]|uniref:Glutathione S-transferase n=1 Tax=Phoenix dactylifera TaxID=42345 RepID=A0A8B7C7D5_PHODC|nr:glutathione transferase GST 23-like isoform X2 [Phoenix dactylifera]